MAKNTKETPEERQARIAAWHKQNEERRQAAAEERRAEKQKHRESYDDRNDGVGHAAYPDDCANDEAAEQPKLNEKQRRKKRLSQWYESVIKDDEISIKDRLSAASQLQRLEGFEKQEVEVKVDGLTQFFDAQLKLIEAQPMPWQKNKAKQQEQLSSQDPQKSLA